MEPLSVACICLDVSRPGHCDVLPPAPDDDHRSCVRRSRFDCDERSTREMVSLSLVAAAVVVPIFA